MCGVFEHGVARFRCEGCGREHLLPFSCKGRAWCPSCGGRRMTEPAAHLVDAVLPWVPVRQWVLTVPYWLRYQMAWNHGLKQVRLRRNRRSAIALVTCFRIICTRHVTPALSRRSSLPGPDKTTQEVPGNSVVPAPRRHDRGSGAGG